ncbi:tRNA pseudouridine(38-40) synthase TruA [Roseivirga thermotolerans]|uniref:tRNA pseudouridine(38-40) synthase TruA n=1 Tax=Roseivirga thermotolerans TaxID=1758176 RepID=UPI00273D20CC|nr:tRNA pseudouridine(38-40) synthase TruA [Roseivirga thermotolerans]
MKASYFYLVHIQYLGYRFHGWAKQPNVKTIHYMIDRTLTFIMENRWFKTLGASRTDAMVSSNHGIFELFLTEPIEDESAFLELFNKHLPPDIKVLAIEETDRHFNIIKTPKQKEYIYLFAFGQKAHPFSSPFLYTFPDALDLELMAEGAKMYEGEHEFKAYTKKPKSETKTVRTIDSAEIVNNTFLTANFFPSPSYAFRVCGKGFMRNQIRYMMGQLIRLGTHETDLEAHRKTLQPGFDQHLSLVAPSSGLILNNIKFA